MPEQQIAARPVLNGNGSIKFWKTHPALYRMLLTFTIGYFALGLNFLILQPTFLIYHAPNWVWGSIFVLLAAAHVVFLHLHRNLRLVRVAMAVAFLYILILAAGAMEPWIDEQGSLQLPVLYAILAAFKIPLLLEPYLNPMTKRDD